MGPNLKYILFEFYDIFYKFQKFRNLIIKRNLMKKSGFCANAPVAYPLSGYWLRCLLVKFIKRIIVNKEKRILKTNI